MSRETMNRIIEQAKKEGAKQELENIKKLWLNKELIFGEQFVEYVQKRSKEIE